MSTYFAQVTDGVVTDVRVVSREFLEANPQRYTGTWIETFIGVAGKTYAGVGFTYDESKDQFVAPQPYASWSLDANNDWQAPTPKPEGDYMWDEETLAWVEVTVG